MSPTTSMSPTPESADIPVTPASPSPVVVVTQPNSLPDLLSDQNNLERSQSLKQSPKAPPSPGAILRSKTVKQPGERMPPASPSVRSPIVGDLTTPGSRSPIVGDLTTPGSPKLKRSPTTFRRDKASPPAVLVKPKRSRNKPTARPGPTPSSPSGRKGSKFKF